MLIALEHKNSKILLRSESVPCYAVAMGQIILTYCRRWIKIRKKSNVV